MISDCKPSIFRSDGIKNHMEQNSRSLIILDLEEEEEELNGSKKNI
jgi:hypothetical protein